MTVKTPVRIVECGCCGSYHPVDFAGDCRDDKNRFGSEDEAIERLKVAALEVERYEYDDKGDVIEHFVETWPGQMPVETLSLDDTEEAPEPDAVVQPCPYCHTPCQQTDTKGRHVNGLKPLDGDGCEFCNPAPKEKDERNSKPSS
jgi:heterodisulfide reductase subunit B